jgi:EmrB/QacA subfamily drug resistance transporter
VYVLGFAIFILGSALAGLAWNFSSLIVFRVIQAIASSADYPTAMAILTVTFKAGKERAQALGIWSSVFGAGVVFGPLIGGPLIDAFGWRSVFLVNIPVGVIGLVMAWVFIHESTSERKTQVFDWWGAITLGGVLSAIVLVLDKGITWGWLSGNSFLCYGAAIIFAVFFYFIETRHPEPIVDFKFFSNSVFMNAMGNNFIVFIGMMGGVFLVPVFAQTFLGYNATGTGYLFMPMAAALLLAAPLGGALVGRIEPRYVIFASTIVAAFGIYLFTGLDARSSAWAIIVPMTIMAFGLGFGMAQRTGVVAAAVEEHEIGVASALLALARNIAGAFGVALFATLLNSSIESNVLATASHSVLNDPAMIKAYTELILLKAQIAGYDHTFLIASLLVFLGSFIVLWMKVDMQKDEKGEPILIEA